MATKKDQNQKHNRFKDAPWYKTENIPVVLIGGAGGIGSWTAFLLTRAGFNTIVYDYDKLEEHNLGGQLYPRKEIGEPKVDALERLVRDFHDGQLIPVNEKMDENSPTHIYTISAFDNMRARYDMFHNWVTEYGGNPNALFIDGRLAVEQLQIFCIRGTDEVAMKDYSTNHLFKDEEVADAPCTLKQTSHAAAIIGGLITGFFTNHMVNVYSQDYTERDVPFYYEYFIPLNAVTTEQL